MIETSPTTPLPNLPAYLDGNTGLWEPQQLKYLDGNNTWIEPLKDPRVTTYEYYPYKNVFIESFNFSPSTEAIVSSNNTDFTVSGKTISYKGTKIDLFKDIQYLEDDLIIIKAKTPGYYVWTKPGSFGDFKINNGILQHNISAVGTDHTFISVFPKIRQYNLISRTELFFESRGYPINDSTKTTVDRPLDFLNPIKQTANEYSMLVYNNLIDSWPYKTTNPNEVIIKAIGKEKLRLYVLYKGLFYWCSLHLAETLDNNFYRYNITHRSLTKPDYVRVYGSKYLLIKEDLKTGKLKI